MNARLHFPVTDTPSGEGLHLTSFVSPRLSMPDTPQSAEPAARQGVNALTLTVKVPHSGGRPSVTEEAGSAETEVSPGPEAAVMTKSVGAVNVRLRSVSSWSLFVTWNV